MKQVTLAAILAFSTVGVASAQASNRSRSTDETTAHRRVTAARRPMVGGDRLTLALSQFWQAGAWADTTQVRYTAFDAAGNNLERITDEQVLGSWQLRNRRTQTFNAQNQPVTDTIFGISGRALFAYRRTYNAAGQPDTITVRIRLGMNWQNASRDIYTYDAAGKPEKLLWQGNAGGWYNQNEFRFTTDPQGRITTDEQFDWNDNTTSWDPNSLIENAYLPNDSLESATFSNWDAVAGSYEVLGRGRNRYNALGLLDSVYNEPYEVASNSWGLLGVTTYQYDARNNRTVELIQGGASLATQTNISQRLFTYAVTGLADAALLRDGLSVVPNPALDAAELRYELLKPGAMRITLVDLLGRVVQTPLMGAMQGAGAHAFRLDLRGLTPGVYVARLAASTGGVQQVKVVVQ